MNKAASTCVALLGIAIACGIVWLAGWRILLVSLLVVATALAVLRWRPPGEITHTQRATPVDVSPQTWLQREIQLIHCQANSSDPRIPTAVTAPNPSPLPAPTGEEEDMNVQTLTRPVLAASLLLSGCSTLPADSDPDAPPLTIEQANARAPFLPPLVPVVMSGELADQGDPMLAAEMSIQRAKWPLRFTRSFGFGARCVNTLRCSIPYGNLQLGQNKPVRATADTYSQAQLDAFTGGYISPEFPEPVQVSWRSLDGQDHQAMIDLEEIFGDRRLLHVVPREAVDDVPGGDYRGIPDVLIEVNDRSIHVYMRAMVHTRHLQRAGRPLSSYRNDLILARSYRY